jgi:cytochrome c oxidase assembly protein subunit 16
MPPFGSKTLKKPSALLVQIRKHPFLLFGLPFLSIVVGSSFFLQAFTRTRYDYQAQKVQTMNWEEEMGMSKDRKKVDIREEYYVSGQDYCITDRQQRLNNPAYKESSLDAALSSPTPSSSSESKPKKKKFSLAAVDRENLENVRVPRPPGAPEWGAPSAQDAPLKGHRKEDRWV